jgi:hypothetical protein
VHHRSHHHHRGNHHAHRSIIPRHATIAYPTIVPHGIGEIGEAISKPARFIAGRLVCAINVGAALAERGLRGTGSALAHSYDSWGVRSPYPVPGAVAVMDRRGGGHVAIVSRVLADGRVFYWNATGGRRSWQEIEIRGRSVRYRVASGLPGG